MRNFLPSIAAITLLAGSCSAPVLADGGQIRAIERHGDYQITVFSSPNPLRAGPVDVSVLVQYARTGETIRDADIVVEFAADDPSQPPIRAVATADAATNKLLRAAVVELPAPGQWNVHVECTTASQSTPIAVAFAMEAAPPLPRWLSVWPWFTWPIVAVLLFAIHRRLVARRETQRDAIHIHRSPRLIQVASPS
jgi:hypothetical protein